MRDLDAHVSQAAQTDDADLLARPDLPVLQRRVGRDAGAEQRRDGSEVLVRRDAQHEAFLDDDAIRIAAEGVRAAEQGAVVGAGEALFAVLLLALAAGRALRATIHHAADPDGIAYLEAGNAGADGADTADDLVAGNARELGDMPFVAGRMQVGMADAAIKDVDLNIVVARRTPFERVGGEGVFGGLGGVSTGRGHGVVPADGRKPTLA